MKKLIVGDLHGDFELVLKLEYLAETFNYHLLFMGDILDSFEFSPDLQARCLVKVLDLVEHGKADCLMGNHEVSYFEGGYLQCSGWNPETAFKVQGHADRAKRMFKWYVYDKKHKVLFTHAGLTKPLWDEYDFTFVTIPERFAEWACSLNSPLYWIGWARGGRDRCGGPLWCDYYHEFTPVPGLTQVFGHSGYVTGSGPSRTGEDHTWVGEMRVVRGNWNIDCLQREHQVLEYDTDTGDIQVCQIVDEDDGRFSLSHIGGRYAAVQWKE